VVVPNVVLVVDRKVVGVTAAPIVTGVFVRAVDVVVADGRLVGGVDVGVAVVGVAGAGDVVVVDVDGSASGAGSSSIVGTGGSGGVVVTVVSVLAGGVSGAGSLTISSARAETKPLDRQARSMSRLATRARRPLEVGITGLRVAVSGSGPANGPFPQLFESDLPWKGAGPDPWAGWSDKGVVELRRCVELGRVDFGQQRDLVLGDPQHQRPFSKPHDRYGGTAAQAVTGDDLDRHAAAPRSAPPRRRGAGHATTAKDGGRSSHDGQDDAEGDDDPDEEGEEGDVHAQRPGRAASS